MPASVEQHPISAGTEPQRGAADRGEYRQAAGVVAGLVGQKS
jgi:hypothetical protein